MQLYEISNGLGTRTFRRKQGDAHAVAKNLSPRGDVRVRLYDYPSDVGTFEGLFNGVIPKGGFLRAWMLTARGGMQEIEAAKAEAEVLEEQQDEAASSANPDDEAGFYELHPERTAPSQEDLDAL
jgi:hypothetical protein